MSPTVPIVGHFSVKMTGLPRMLMGGPAAPLFSQMAEPPVPTERLIVASSGKVLMLHTHTAELRLDGSIPAYILTPFSQTIVLASWPVSLLTSTIADESV